MRLSYTTAPKLTDQQYPLKVFIIFILLCPVPHEQQSPEWNTVSLVAVFYWHRREIKGIVTLDHVYVITHTSVCVCVCNFLDKFVPTLWWCGGSGTFVWTQPMHIIVSVRLIHTSIVTHLEAVSYCRSFLLNGWIYLN